MNLTRLRVGPFEGPANDKPPALPEVLTPRTPYVSEIGLQAVIDFIRQRNPQVPNVKPQEFMDNRFIKELDESGFIKSLYAKPS